MAETQRDKQECFECGMTLQGRVALGLGQCLSCFQAACRREASKRGDVVTHEDEHWLSHIFRSSVDGDFYLRKMQRVRLPEYGEELARNAKASAAARDSKLATATQRHIQILKTEQIDNHQRLRRRYDVIVSPPGSLPFPLSCVYMVQLLLRRQTVKIGFTTCGRKRIMDLRRRYGPLCILLVIPDEQPDRIERKIHRYLTRYRIYDDAYPSELFSCSFRQFQQALEWLKAQYELVTYHDFLLEESIKKASEGSTLQLPLPIT